MSEIKSEKRKAKSGKWRTITVNIIGYKINRHRILKQYNLLIFSSVKLTLTVENNTSISINSDKLYKYSTFDN